MDRKQFRKKDSDSALKIRRTKMSKEMEQLKGRCLDGMLPGFFQE